MQKIADKILEKCKSLLQNGTIDRILGWEKGIFNYDISPAIFNNTEDLNNFVYNEYCGSNLSKYLVKESKKDGKILVLLKPCDTYSFNQLLLEHHINRDNIYILGVPCGGMKDEKGLLLKCMTCKGDEHKAFDEVIEADISVPKAKDRFELVKKLDDMTSDQRFDFWRGELSKCIRCNACRNVCPACTCIKCIFDNHDSGVDSKSNPDSFEENMFHIIRAFHVAGRCTDCGECSRVCPQGIPLHLFNRKYIMEINELYGEYQAGETCDSRPPLANFNQEDVEPSVVYEKGRG